MKLFKNIGKLYTLKRAAKKGARGLELKDLSVQRNQAFITNSKGIITWLGKSDRVPKNLWVDKEYDLKGQNVFPAFVDCHSHLIFGGNRSEEFELRNTGISYQKIAKKGGGILSTVKQTRKASLGDLVKVGQERVSRFIDQGVTSIEVKSGYGLNFQQEKKILQAANHLKKARIFPTYLGPHAKSPNFQNLDAYLKRILERDLKQIKKEGLANRADIFIEKGYFNFNHLKSYVAKAKELNFDLTIHAEQMSSSGITSFACKEGVKSLDHLVYIKGREINTLAKSNTVAVLLPTAEKYIHLPMPPARKLIDKGAIVALSCDFNPGSSPTQDLSFLGVLARLDLKMALHEVFCAMTIGAAYALGFERWIGSLEKGKYADFFTSEADLFDFFYGVGQHPVDQVFREGKKLR